MTDPTSRTTASYNHIAPTFAARTTDPGPAYAAFRHRFAAALPATSPVADLGCGPGRDARWFADQGIGVVGCDRSPAMGGAAALVHPPQP